MATNAVCNITAWIMPIARITVTVWNKKKKKKEKATYRL